MVELRSPETLWDVVRAAAARRPDAVAVAVPGQRPLTYRHLVCHIEGTRHALHGAGVCHRDRVALVVPNGPELAVALLSVVASAVCVPLNSGYRDDEFAFYLTDLRPSVLVVQSALDSPVRQLASQRGIPIIELVPDPRAEAGLFTLSGAEARNPTCDTLGAPPNTALVLHTSGTTTRSKRVPLTHTNLLFTARKLVVAFALSDDDRCLNLMPLYHGVGLHALLPTLVAGGSIVCPRDADPEAFYGWLDEFRPSWYTATPPIHHAILSRARGFRDVVTRRPLRFIRSGTGTLPLRTLRELEVVFSAPVIETYGMTEVGQIAVSPLPPTPRKPGSVGVPVAPEVAVMDDSGTILPPGTTGEIVVRGPNVMTGYDNDPEANAAAFRDGWFRTGDLGVLDSDGYLFLRGRVKEMINRGGEKIAPHEVEARLAEHPAVAEAVVFPLPHPTLGEDVAAAVVLHGDASVAERDLRQFVGLRLAAFKVPCRILLVDEIPKGSSGKARRQDLAEHFRPLLATEFVAPANPLEQALARIFAEELEIDHVGVHGNFFELGGDSLRAARMCARVQATTGRPLSVATVFSSPTVAQLARALQQRDLFGRSPTYLVAIRAEGSRPPLFCMHGRMGHVADYFPLARHLDPDQPVYGIEARGADGTHPPLTTMEDLAAHCVSTIRAFYPQGPYLLCGYSLAGLLAWEVAQQFKAAGQRVALLALFDTNLHLNPVLEPAADAWALFFCRRIEFHLNSLRAQGSPKARFGYLAQRLTACMRAIAVPQRAAEQSTPVQPHAPWLLAGDNPDRWPATWVAIVKAYASAGRSYFPRTYPGRVAVFLAREELHRRDPRLPGRLAAGHVEVDRAPGNHSTLLSEPHVRVLARTLQARIDKAIQKSED